MLDLPQKVFMAITLLKHVGIYEKAFSKHFLIRRVLVIYFLKNVCHSSNTLFRRLENEKLCVLTEASKSTAKPGAN